MIRSSPPNAHVYAGNTLLGVTPLRYTVTREEYRKGDLVVRVEREGYRPTEGRLWTRVCPGRVVGGIFTLGILFIFKGPTCLASVQDFPLAPIPGYTASGTSAPAQPSVEERLERIEKMRQEGAITNEEYQRYRAEIFKDL